MWRKSSYSSVNGGECVEVAVMPDGGALVRDGKRRDEILTFTRAEWEAFVDGVKDGEFDPPRR